MARELNVDLLNSLKGMESNDGNAQPAKPAYAKADEVRVAHLHIEALNKRLKEFESRLEVMTAKVDEMTAQNKIRFERVQGHFHRQTEMLTNGMSDMHSKLAHVVSRVNERRVEDNVVKEMVERHAHVVTSFEARMQQLQRVISEQEMQLMGARAELRAAIQEIARLKKM
jgi:chromosome segregation ATPase